MLRIAWGGHYLVILNHNGTFMMFWPTTNWHYRSHIEIGCHWLSHFRFIYSLWGYWLASSYFAKYFRHCVSIHTYMPLGFYCSMASNLYYLLCMTFHCQRTILAESCGSPFPFVGPKCTMLLNVPTCICKWSNFPIVKLLWHNKSGIEV